MIKLFEKIGKMLTEVAAIVENHEQRITNLEIRLKGDEDGKEACTKEDSN